MFYGEDLLMTAFAVMRVYGVCSPKKARRPMLQDCSIVAVSLEYSLARHFFSEV